MASTFDTSDALSDGVRVRIVDPPWDVVLRANTGRLVGIDLLGRRVVALDIPALVVAKIHRECGKPVTQLAIWEDNLRPISGEDV